ncbi:MAG: hypothetical protein P8Y45_24600 [Exilibacterium sp.]
MKRKPAATHNIGIDIDPQALSSFHCDYPVRLVNDCAHRFLADEFATLEAQFEQLSSEGKITPDSRTLFQGLLMLVRLMMAVFMEKTTKKYNRNSRKPSSQTPKDETSTSQAGSKSKGTAQNDAVSDNTRTIETTELVEVDTCETCGEDLSDTPCLQQERRTLIDIVFEKV